MLQVVIVRAGVVAVVHFQMPGRIVDRLGPGEGIQEIQTTGKSLLQFDLQSVVIGKTAAPCFLDGGETLDRTPRIQRKILARILRARLVGIGQNHELHAAVAHVRHIEDKVLG